MNDLTQNINSVEGEKLSSGQEWVWQGLAPKSKIKSGTCYYIVGIHAFIQSPLQQTLNIYYVLETVLGTRCTMMTKKWFLPLRNCQSKRKISTSQLLFNFIKDARSQKKLFPSSFCRVIIKLLLLLLLNYSHRQTWLGLKIIARCLQKIQNVPNISKSTNFSVLCKEKAKNKNVGRKSDRWGYLSKEAS